LAVPAGVEHRIPDVREIVVDEQHARCGASSEKTSEMGRRQYAGYSPVDDHHPVHGWLLKLFGAPISYL
jgi:hypothetical protein